MKKCKAIGNYLSHSTKAYHRLVQIQKEMNRTILKYINEVCTRWDSEYESLKRVKEMKIELTVFLNEVYDDLGVTLTNTDWDVLEKLVSLLQIFQQLTVTMSERYANASIIIPQVICVMKAVDNTETKKSA